MTILNLPNFPKPDGQQPWGADSNFAFKVLSSHIALNVIGTTITGAGGVDGDAQIDLATGQYSCKNDGGWTLYQPRKGVLAVDVVGDIIYYNTGSSWESLDISALTADLVAKNQAISDLEDNKIDKSSVNPNNALDLNFIQSGTGAVNRTSLAKMRETVTPQDFGAVGDGVADDTAALQAAITYCDTNRLYLDLGRASGNTMYKITSGLTSNGLMLGIINGSLVRIRPQGSGYTAVTIGDGVTPWRMIELDLYVFPMTARSGSLNGVWLRKPIGSRIGDIKVYGFDGFGVKIDDTWDCTYNTITVEECGNLTEYAFSLNDVADNSNMSHFYRIQVELSHNKAMYINPNALSCVFDNIHSERTRNFYNTVKAWVLGGNGCQYNLGRFQALNAGAQLDFNSGGTTYVGMRLEGDLDVEIVTYGTVGTKSVFVNPSFLSAGQTISVLFSNQAETVFRDGRIVGQLNVGNQFSAYNANINGLDIGFTNASSNMRFIDCKVTTLTSSSTNNSATFRGCSIAECGGLLQGATTLIDCNVTSAATIALSFERVFSVGTTFNGNVTLNNAHIKAINTVFNGNVSVSAGGNQCLFDDATYCTGVVSGVNSAPVAGAYIGTLSRGMRHKNIAPIAGGPKAWVYDGVAFVSEGNL